MPNASFQSTSQAVAAVVGENTAQGDGVFGIGHGATGRGIVGTSEQATAVTGVSSQTGAGVWGTSQHGTGVFGETQNSNGTGVTGQNLLGGRAVQGIATAGDAVFGVATGGGRGVVGTSDSHTGVEGHSDAGTGVWGSSNTGMAGHFEGDVTVTGDLSLTGADFAEQFELAAGVLGEPGTVMIVGDDGTILPCNQPYDQRTIGVVSGAGDYKAAIVLDKQTSGRRVAIALLGKTFCKVNADFGAIAIGDLITTSPTLGHAMKASDAARALGCVIGKALRPHSRSTGLIPILVTMQ